MPDLGSRYRLGVQTLWEICCQRSNYKILSLALVAGVSNLELLSDLNFMTLSFST